MKKYAFITLFIYSFICQIHYSQCTSSINAIQFSDDTLCGIGYVNITIDGGNLGNSTSWQLFTGNCGGTLIATSSNNNFTNIPVNTTTTFYCKADSCDVSSCVSGEVFVVETPSLDSIIIDSLFNNSDSTWSILDTVCPQTEVKLFADYNFALPTNHSIVWHKSYCGSPIIGTGDSISVYPDSSTTYYAKIVGPCGSSLCKQVTIITKDGSIAPIGIQTSNNNFCTGGSATLSVVGGQLGTGANWSWYESACSSNFLGTGSSISVTPAATTMYYVRANGGDCGATSCQEILINTYDLNVYHSNVDSTCESSPFVLQGGFPQGGTYTGVGVLGSIFDPNISGIGSHTVTYSYTDSNNCTNSTQFPVVVLEANIDPISISANLYEICNGNSTTISIDNSNQLINGSQWVWYKGSCGTGSLIGSTTTNNQITVSPSTTSNYYVRSEGGLCPASNCIGLTIDVYTLETHLGEFDEICGEDHPIFELEGGNPSGGTFSGNGVNNGFFDPKIAGVGNHNITYTYTLGPCVATDVETIQIENSPIKLDYSIEQETCAEGGIMIHIHSQNGMGYYGYDWSDGSYENPLTYANNEIYNVLVSDANNCYKLLDSITFDNTLECIEMPNTFSPNDDGINDYWSLNFPNYEEASLVIFNKWGNQIWEFNGGNNMSWNGKTTDGLDIPSGTYYYTIELTDALGQTTNQTGPITIIR